MRYVFKIFYKIRLQLYGSFFSGVFQDGAGGIGIVRSRVLGIHDYDRELAVLEHSGEFALAGSDGEGAVRVTPFDGDDGVWGNCDLCG